MASKLLLLVIAALVVIAIDAQSTPDDDDYFDDNTGDQAPEPKEAATEKSSDPAPVAANADTKQDTPIEAGEPISSTEAQPTASSSVSSLKDSPASQPTAQTTEKETNQIFVYMPAPPNPFPNFVPMPPFYPGQPPQPMPPFYPGPAPQPMAPFQPGLLPQSMPPFYPGQPPQPIPQYPYIQPPMPMMFPPPPPSNGQALPYPQPNQAGQPQLILVNQHKNPAGYVMGESTVYLKPDRNQEYIIIKSN